MKRVSTVVSGLAALAFGLAVSAQSAKADFVYDLTLTSTSGPTSGTGVLSLTSAVPSSGLDSLGPGPVAGVDLFTVTIDGHLFNLTNTFTNVSFLNGALFNLGFAAFASPLQVTASGTTYTFADISNQSVDSLGSITAIAAPVPEASTWAMLLLGFAGLGFMAYRRKNSETSAHLA
jgi:PEP-CTERM motif